MTGAPTPAADLPIGRWLARARRFPGSIAAVVCLGLGALSVALLPSIPGYDPFSWVVWGRELAHHIIGPPERFIAQGGPSWKPFPMIFTTIFGFFSDAPTLWVAFLRAGGLLGLFVAYRLGARLGASERWRLAGPVAGVLAAVAVGLTAQWTHDMFRAVSEPLTVTATLLAIERATAGRRMAAFWSGVALALMRPEAAVLVAVYAVWCLWRMDGIWRRAVVLAGLALLPAAWVVPPWLGAGSPLLAANHARAYYHNHGTGHVVSLVLGRATGLTPWPVLVAALVMALLALYRRQWPIVALAGASLAYVAIVLVMTFDRYPGLARFMLPAAAVACVLAGAGVVRLATLAGVAIERPAPPAGAMAGALAATAAMVAIAVPFFAPPVTAASAQAGMAQQAVSSYDKLLTAMRRVGAAEDVLPCGSSRAAVNHTLQPSLAWALGVPLTAVHGVTRVDHSLHGPALAFFAPGNAIVGGSPRRLRRGLRARLLAREGMWRVLRVTGTRNPSVDRCVGD